MKKYTEQKLTKAIRERIKSEYRKHKGFEWDLIAAIKIVRMLKEENIIIEKIIYEKDNDLSTLSEIKSNW